MPVTYRGSRNSVSGFAKSVGPFGSTMSSPFAATGGKIIQKEEKFLPSVAKKRVLHKFFEVATMQDPVQPGALTANFDSSKVTAAIVNQVSKEHQLIQSQLMRQATQSRQTTTQGRNSRQAA